MMGIAITLALCLLIPMVQAASLCAPGFCQNGGTCSDFTGSANCARCSCPANFTGDKCEKDVDECAVSDPCKNRATCINFYGGYTCRCINGWEGSGCSINTDDCATSDGSSKCLQGGSCIDRVRRFYCLCPPNYTGPICQYENECLTLSPCYGDAKCFTNGFGKYSCACTKGWTGKNCDTDIDECAASSMSPCHQGGTCVNTPGHFVCQCPVGLTGERCEIDVNECAFNPCQNGGVCLNHRGRYECFCKGGWTGQLCEQPIK